MKKRSILPLAALIAAAIWNIVLRIRRDDIVINSGIRAYRSMAQTALTVLIIVIVICAAVFIIGSVSAARRKKKEIPEQPARRSPGKLSSKRMDGIELRQMLEASQRDKWRQTAVSVSDIEKQMDQMDSYQDSLSELLKDNDAEALGDTEDILDQVEQNMFRNIRTVLNFMNVADVTDQDKVIMEIHQCRQKNGSLLSKTKDFLYALTDYLNGQGNDTSTDMLDTYRETILEALRKH